MRRLAVLLLVVLLGCTPAQPTPAGALLAPTARPAAAGVPIARATLASPFTPTPAPDVVSPGLGLTRTDWEALSARATGGFGVLAGTATVTVGYLDGRVATIDRDGKPLDVETARSEARIHFLPPDALYLRTDRSTGGAVVDVFRSPSLAGRFPSAGWREPGAFSATYRLDDQDRVRAYRVALGP